MGDLPPVEPEPGDAMRQEAMRLAITLHRPKENRSGWARAEDALDMATTAGAAALQCEARVGRIAVGQSADLVLYDLARPRWTPCNAAHMFRSRTHWMSGDRP